MDHSEVKALNKALADVKKEHGSGLMLMWMPDSDTAQRVIMIGKHAEEEDDEPCAIFSGGKYAALYNCQLSDFVFATRLLP